MKTGDRAEAAGAVIKDINGDGLSDLVVTNDANEPDAGVVVFSQNKSGGLDPAKVYPTYDCPEPVVIADVNSDGRNDIVVAHAGWFALGVLLQNVDGSMKEQEEYHYLPYASRYNTQGLP